MTSDGQLFSNHPLRVVIESYRQRLPEEIQNLNPNRVLGSSFADLAQYFEKLFFLDVPRLRTFETERLPSEEVDVDVSGDRSRDFRGDAGPHFVSGIATTIAVPFDGDPRLFNHGSMFGLRPRGTVHESELHLTHTTADPDASEIERALEQRIQEIEQALRTIQSEADVWNNDLPRLVTELLNARKTKILKDRQTQEALSFPLRRTDSPSHPVPVKRKPLVVTMPAAPKAPFKPEPTLDMQQYEEILRMLANMAESMERTPKAFSQLDEEMLRDQFLMVLNANFEGNATGETFNVDGKTDILIKAQGRNIFIAECKFWKGPKALRDAVDQLLNYLSWRDTKASILVFNRGTEFSTVLKAIPDAIAAHPLFKRTLPYAAPNGFRFAFGQRDDANRETILTVLAFNVPPGRGSDAKEDRSPTPE